MAVSMKLLRKGIPFSNRTGRGGLFYSRERNRKELVKKHRKKVLALAKS